MNWPPWVSLLMSVWVRPSRYFAFERLVAKARQQLGAAVGDVDRATQTELGLIEQEGEGVLGDHRIGLRPAQNALANRHRVNAEFAERSALELAIGRMVLDPLDVAAEAIALVQLRHVAVGQARAFVEMAAGERTGSSSRCGSIWRNSASGRWVRSRSRQRRVGAVEIHAGGVGRQQSRLVRRHSRVGAVARRVHGQALFVRCRTMH